MINLYLFQGFLIDKYFDQFEPENPVNEVVMMTCGTGLAPIAAAIDSKMLNLGENRVGRLYIGVNTLGHLPMRQCYGKWLSWGIKVIPVIYYPPKGWSGETGFIQDDLKKDRIPSPKNTGILICGRK
jgi:NAD(P)H-flavin reductase